MNVSRVAILIKGFILTVSIFLLFCKPLIAEEPVDSTTIMNAFVGLTLEGYSGKTLREKLKSIIDREAEFNGNEWERWLLEAKEIKDNSKISNNIKCLRDLLNAYALTIAVYQLHQIASDDFTSLEFTKIKKSRKKYYFLIPKEVKRNHKYLDIAMEILKQNSALFMGSSDSGDFEKIFANYTRNIDLYKEVQESYIACLGSYNNDFANRKKYLKIYKKKNEEFKIESTKSDIYIAQKINQLFKKYGFNENIDMETSAKSLMKLEKEYENKY